MLSSGKLVLSSRGYRMYCTLWRKVLRILLADRPYYIHRFRRFFATYTLKSTLGLLVMLTALVSTRAYGADSKGHCSNPVLLKDRNCIFAILRTLPGRVPRQG